MNNSNKLPKIFQTTIYVAFGYAICLIIYSIYLQFFFIEKNWFHSLISNGFTILSSLIWIGILLIFKKLLNTILKFNKVNLLLDGLVIFLSIQIFSLALFLYKILNLYITLKNAGDLNSMFSFASGSISSIILFFISNFAIILLSFLLGFRLKKIDFFEKKMFIILSYSLMAYSVLNLVVSLVLIKTDFFTFLFKAIAVYAIGQILQKIYNLNSSQLYTSFGYKKENERLKTNKAFFSTNIKEESKQKKNLQPKENYVNQEEVYNIKFDQHEHKDFVINYYENLSEEELNLLKNKILTEDKNNLVDEEKTNLILQHIFENKLYDFLRFMPKK